MVKEFRALSRAEAVEAMYQNMAAQHRARFRNVQILRVAEIEKKEDVRRPYMKQLLEPGLKFPLPHRRTKSKAWYAANRPVSDFNETMSVVADCWIVYLGVSCCIRHVGFGCCGVRSIGRCTCSWSQIEHLTNSRHSSSSHSSRSHNVSPKAAL